jgi:serine phosphatase RsbU (regulator of sigma subunit)
VLDLQKLGTRFLVFSDGITEQFNADGEMFTTEGLHEAFRRYADAPLEELVGGIVSELTSFRGTALVKDDRTLLALDLRGDAV